MTVSLFKKVLLLYSFVSFKFKVEAACSQLGETCSEDCECCGTETNPGIKCETRDTASGDRKCYLSNKIGDTCTTNSECKSQWCSGGICVPKFTHKPKSMANQKYYSYCKLELNVEEVIDGSVTKAAETCACANPGHPNKSNAQELIFSPGTTYANNYALGSGFILRPVTSGPLRFLDVCTGEGDYYRDPTSYKIQRKCADTGTLKTIQEGALSFPLREKGGPEYKEYECTRVTIKAMKSLYLHYYVTFPTQRGGDPSCSTGCKDYPTVISELALYAHCNQVAEAPDTRAPTPLPTLPPTPAPTYKTRGSAKVYVKNIYKPCDRDGSWNQSDVYVNVYMNGSYCGKTYTINEANEDKYNYFPNNGYVYCSNKYLSNGRYSFKFTVCDNDSGKCDYMGETSTPTYSSFPFTIRSSGSYLSSSHSDCRRTMLAYEIQVQS